MNLLKLNRDIALRVMGWVQTPGEWYSYLAPNGEPHGSCPAFSSNIDHAFQVEDRIKELGLEEEYGERLSEEIQRQSSGKHGIFYGSEVFDIAHASAELRCRVALECVKEKAKAAGG